MPKTPPASRKRFVDYDMHPLLDRARDTMARRGGLPSPSALYHAQTPISEEERPLIGQSCAIPIELLYASLKHRIGWLSMLVDSRMFCGREHLMRQLFAQAEHHLYLLEANDPSLPAIWTMKFCRPDEPCVPR
jgi:hypothetical protein